ncbi:MAG: hypothetical protein ACXWAV_03440 [Chthoniobacterales bacterium]
MSLDSENKPAIMSGLDDTIEPAKRFFAVGGYLAETYDDSLANKRRGELRRVPHMPNENKMSDGANYEWRS